MSPVVSMFLLIPVIKDTFVPYPKTEVKEKSAQPFYKNIGILKHEVKKKKANSHSRTDWTQVTPPSQISIQQLYPNMCPSVMMVMLMMVMVMVVVVVVMVVVMIRVDGYKTRVLII